MPVVFLVGVPELATEVSGTGIVVPNIPVSDTGIEFVPNYTGVFGRVLRQYRILPKTSVGYLPRKYPRYTLLW